MKLKPRTTYLNKWGEKIHIAGPCNYKVDGKEIFWSIQGDHYAEDGRFVSSKAIEKGGEIIDYVRYLLAHTFGRTIEKVDDTPGAEKWWEGVITR